MDLVIPVLVAWGLFFVVLFLVPGCFLDSSYYLWIFQ